MPKHVRTIELYTCDFKCGHKAAPKYSIQNHEERCYCNPDNKACRICSNCSIEDKFMVCKFHKFRYKIEKRNVDSDGKVYDDDMNVLWEILPMSPDISWSDLNDVIRHNENRLFPRKNCENFILGKKIY